VISLKQLIARGPEGNPNIILTDYVIDKKAGVVESKERSKTWTKVWVPAAPKDEVTVFPDGRADFPNVRAILMSTHVSNETELATRLQKDRLPGMVTNRVTKLGPTEKRLLRESYPNTDLDRCLIIEEGREPSGVGKVMALGAAGVILVLAGIGALIVGIVRRR
jgi:hypothetical protein